jgi:hypothetical protein
MAMRDGDQAGVRPVWTEDELERALAGLYMDIKTNQRGLTKVRENLMVVVDDQAQPRLGTTGTDTVETGEDARRRRPLRRWLAAAAAVAVLAAGGVLAQTVLFSTATAQAQEVLTSAADVAARAKDPVLAPGQYRYVATHAWWMKTIGKERRSFSFLNENLIETWIPADPNGEWLRRRRETGNRKWVTGSEAEARAAGAGAMIEGTPWPDQRAKGGNFVENAPEHGNWQFPKPAFLASLPTDPEQLYERLGEDSGGGKQSLVYAADALRSGLMPAAARANLLRALTYLPGLDVTDGAADLDGHKGVALGISEDGERQEIILNPSTGEVIGEREVSDSMFADIPKGTVTSYSSITTAVVDHIGAKPTR